MTALALRPAHAAIIARANEQAAKIASIVEVHELRTPEDEASAGVLVRAIATIRGEVEDARKAEKSPHLAACREVDGAFKPVTLELDRVDTMLRRRLGEAAERRDTARREALRLASEAAQKGNVAAANAALATVAPDVTIAGVSERWGYEIAGIVLESVPLSWLMLDLTKVKAYARDCAARGEEPKIPGIVFKRTADVAVRKLTP